MRAGLLHSETISAQQFSDGRGFHKFQKPASSIFLLRGLQHDATLLNRRIVARRNLGIFYQRTNRPEQEIKEIRQHIAE